MCWVYCAIVMVIDGLLTFVASALSVISIPIAPLSQVFIDNWFLARSGIPEAIGILSSALLVRLSLNLIPFLRI